MTAPEATLTTQTANRNPAEAASWRRVLIFGTGFGIAVSGKDLEIVVARARSGGAKLVGATRIADFRSRPAAEWGSEVSKFLASIGENNLAAAIVLPREQVIVRTIQLPGVADKDIASAIELQIDTLHPWGDEEIAWTSMKADRGAVVVGLVRKALLTSWETLFSEAGIPVAAVTFSSAAIHAALRIWGAAPASFLVYSTVQAGRTEVYGESEGRPFYSAEFAAPLERALAIARSELRLPTDHEAAALGTALPAPAQAAAEFSSMAYTAALAASAPLVARYANLIPAERRASNTRRQYLVPAILAAVLATSAIVGFGILPALERRNYLAALNDEAHRLEPAALRAQTLEKTTNSNRARIAALDDIKRRPQADLDVLNELTRILPPQAWTNSIEIYPDSVVISGEADQAAPLLKLLDSSPLFQNSEFALSVTHNAQNEQFRIKSMRRGRIGRPTP